MKKMIIFIVKWMWIIWKVSPRIKITHKLNGIYAYKQLAKMKFGKKLSRTELIKKRFPNIRMADDN